MERDFLGLSRESCTPAYLEECPQPIYKHPAATGMQTLWPSSKLLHSPSLRLPYSGSIFLPFGNDNYPHNQSPLSFPENAWISPLNNASSSSSTSLSQDISLAKDNLVEDMSKTTAAMTVFYSGAVHVFPDVPPETAEVIMRVAASQPITGDAQEILQLCSRPENNGKTVHAFRTGGLGGLIAGLAMARKATLARFLEKRMHRLSKTKPYNCNLSLGESSGS